MTSKECLREAARRGYVVKPDGSVAGPRGSIAFRRTSDGYRAISMKVDGKVKNVPVHRLAAFQKFGDRIFDPGIVVRHLNEDHLDNSVDNLGIGTPSANQMDRDPDDRRAHAIRSSRALRRYDNMLVAAVRADRIAGLEYRDIAAKHGIPHTTVFHMVKKATY